MRRALTLTVVLVLTLCVTASARADVSQPPQPGAVSLYATSAGYHWTGTTAAPGGYSLVGTLGFVQAALTPGTVALYSCQNGSVIEFLSLDPACGGATAVSKLGYIYTQAPNSVASNPLYACADGPDRYASNSPTCDGNTVVSQLGYLPSSAALNRSDNPTVGQHWATTGLAPSGYTFEGTLGYLVNGGAGTSPLYQCQNGNEQFLAEDSTCGGSTPAGIEGWVYSSFPSSPATYGLNACHSDSSDFFMSDDSGCEGQTLFVPAGYVLTSAILPPPAATTTTTPVAQSAPTAPAPAKPKPGAKPGIHLDVKLAWTWRGAIYHLHSFKIANKLPAHTVLTVSCKGHACPHVAPKKPRHGSPTVTQAVDAALGRNFRVGDVVSIAFSAPGRTTAHITVKILSRGLPQLRRSS